VKELTIVTTSRTATELSSHPCHLEEIYFCITSYTY